MRNYAFKYFYDNSGVVVVEANSIDEARNLAISKAKEKVDKAYVEIFPIKIANSVKKGILAFEKLKKHND